MKVALQSIVGLRCVCRLSFGLLLSLPVSAMSAEVAKEYQIKAAFLYNFAKFVEWPAQSSATTERPIVIGVLATNPFGDELKNIVHGRRINGRSLTVKVVRSPAEAVAVDLLFIPDGQEKLWDIMKDKLSHAGVLTVGESHHFLSLGGIIGFVLEGEKVRFSINLAAASESGLKISAQLLKLATSVSGSP